MNLASEHDAGKGYSWDPEWEISETLVPYPDAITKMEARIAAIRSGAAPELIWLLEHPPLYTAGTSAKSSDLLAPHDLPVYQTGRGGQYTYHGPGQRIAYAMLDLRRRGIDIRCYVHLLEEWLIQTLSILGVKGERRGERIGIWVRRPDRNPGHEDKIAAIGVRIRQGVSYHGVALNLNPDLAKFSGIVPCGIRQPDYGVTSLQALGIDRSFADIDGALKMTLPPLLEAAGSGL